MPKSTVTEGSVGSDKTRGRIDLVVGVANDTDVPPRVVIETIEGSGIDYDRSLLRERILGLLHGRIHVNGNGNGSNGGRQEG